MIRDIPTLIPDFAKLTALRDFTFGESVERRVEVYARRSPSSQLVLNIDRTGRVTSSGLASPRADLILTVWPGSKTLSGTVIPNNDTEVIRRVVIRRPNQTRAEFARELLKELGKEIREHADKQLNETFGAEVMP